MKNIEMTALGGLLGLLMAGVILHIIKDSVVWAMSHPSETEGDDHAG
jgi:hypothetical protein